MKHTDASSSSEWEDTKAAEYREIQKAAKKVSNKLRNRELKWKWRWLATVNRLNNY